MKSLQNLNQTVVFMPDTTANCKGEKDPSSLDNDLDKKLQEDKVAKLPDVEVESSESVAGHSTGVIEKPEDVAVEVIFSVLMIYYLAGH